MDANVLNDHLNSCKKKLLTQSKLDDSHKIQIESVDSSLKDDQINTDTVFNNAQSYKERRLKKNENEHKPSFSKNKNSIKDVTDNDGTENEDSENECQQSNKSFDSSGSLSSTGERQLILKKKRKRHRNRVSRKRYQDSKSNARSEHSSTSFDSRSRSSSHSSSVSDLLSDSCSDNNSNTRNTNKIQQSSDSDSLHVSRMTPKIKSKKMRIQKKSKGSYRTRSCSSSANGENVSEVSFQETFEQNPESDVENSNSDVDYKSDRSEISYRQENDALRLHKINKIKKKCIECINEIKKCLKQLKANKRKKSLCTSTKDKLRYDLIKKKYIKRKRKLEKKYSAYKCQINSLKSEKYKNESKFSNSEHEDRHFIKSSVENYQNFDEKGHINRLQMNEENMQMKHHGSGDGSLKIPYPILNDKRDLKTIMLILKEKQVNLNQMLDQTLSTLDNLERERNSKINRDDLDSRFTRLQHLEENIKVQLTRLTRQIDYINYSLDINKTKKILKKCESMDKHSILNEMNLDYSQLDQLKKKMIEQTKKVDHLLTFMKDANRRFLNQQEQAKYQHNENKEKPIKSIESNYEAYLSEKNTSSDTVTPVLNFSYYRSVPPPKINKKISSPEEKNNLNETSIKVTPSINPNHNIQNIVADSASFNSSRNCSSYSHKIKFNQEDSHIKTNNIQSTEKDELYFDKSKEVSVEKCQEIRGSQNEILDFNSDPKAIAAMLNEKYGKIKSSDPKASSYESSEVFKHPQKQTYCNQEKSYIKNNNNNLNSIDDTDNYSKIKAALMTSNLPSSMVNSPAFMQTMTNMLLTMSNQGINISTILNQMPSILSNFDVAQNESKNLYPEDQEYSYSMFTERSNKNRASFKNEQRTNFDYNNQRNKQFKVNQSNDSLLPTPRDYESSEGCDFNFSQAFFNCLSSFSQNIDSSAFNITQFNSMLNESAANFNEYYNSGYDNEYHSYNESNNNNWNNSRSHNNCKNENFYSNQQQNALYGYEEWNLNQNENFRDNLNSQSKNWHGYHGYSGKNNRSSSYNYNNNNNNNSNHKYKRKKN